MQFGYKRAYLDNPDIVGSFCRFYMNSIELSPSSIYGGGEEFVSLLVCSVWGLGNSFNCRSLHIDSINLQL